MPLEASHYGTLGEFEKETAPISVWASFHVLRKMIAGLAKLREVANQCRLGKLAITEISELTGDDEIRKIDPHKAKIVGVKVDKTNHIVEIFFEMEKEENNNVTIILAGVSVKTRSHVQF